MNMKMRNAMILSLLLFIFFGTSSCIEEEINFEELPTNVDFEAGFAAPIGYAEMTIHGYLTNNSSTEELVEEYLADVDDYLIHLIYKDTVSTGPARNYIYFSPMSKNFTVNSKAKETFVLDFALAGADDAELSKIEFKTTEIKFQANSSDGGNVTIKLPTVTKNDNAFQATFALNSGEQTFSLAGYVGLLEYGGAYNKLPIEITVSSDKNTTTDATVSVSLSNISYDNIYGYIGQRVFDFWEDVTIDVFDDMEGNFYLEEPELKLIAHSTFDVPIEIDLFQLASEFDTILIGNQYPFTISGTHPTDSIVLSDIKSLFNNFLAGLQPEHVAFSANGSVNPDGFTTTNKVNENSEVKLALSADISAFGWTELIYLKDTIEFDFNQYIQDNDSAIFSYDEIEEVILRFNFTNGLPIEVHPEVIMVNIDTINNMTQIIDTLISYEDVFLEPALDTDGNDYFETPREHAPKDISFTQEYIDKLKQCTHLIVYGSLKTVDAENETSLRLYSSYGLYAQVAIRIKVKGNTGNL